MNIFPIKTTFITKKLNSYTCILRLGALLHLVTGGSPLVHVIKPDLFIGCAADAFKAFLMYYLTDTVAYCEVQTVPE